ncbi:MAG TPA: hypothetical protein VGE65_00910 [Sphingobium sp.]
MSPIFNLFVAAALSGATVADRGSQRLAEPTDLVFGRANSEIALKTDILKGILGKEHYDWSVDLEEGWIRFTSPTKVVSAPVQVIGTYNTLDGTFLWGWDHPSVPKALGAHARLARQFGQKNNLPQFTTRKVKCTEQEAWAFTAVALYLANAQGAYRGPSGSTMVFMTFGTIKISPRT